MSKVYVRKNTVNTHRVPGKIPRGECRHFYYLKGADRILRKGYFICTIRNKKTAHLMHRFAMDEGDGKRPIKDFFIDLIRWVEVKPPTETV